MEWNTVDGEDRGEVVLYTLSSCVWCGKVKDLLNGLGVRYRYVDTDLLAQPDQDEVVSLLDSITEEWGFPVLLLHNKYMLSGYKEKATRKLLGFEDAQAGVGTGGPQPETETDPEVEKALVRLQRFCAGKGWFLNPDVALTRSLVKGLQDNQRRYGYWACPCRLATGNRNEDRDILCPCVYRGPDVLEFGACYCGLYVSEPVFRGEEEARPVPERRKRKEEVPGMSD